MFCSYSSYNEVDIVLYTSAYTVSWLQNNQIIFKCSDIEFFLSWKYLVLVIVYSLLLLNHDVSN